nr:MAG TPA: hypothetical protein [Caudoviricetes sp.]
MRLKHLEHTMQPITRMLMQIGTLVLNLLKWNYPVPERL